MANCIANFNFTTYLSMIIIQLLNISRSCRDLALDTIKLTN